MSPAKSSLASTARPNRRHICHFYRSRQDLAEILVPFYKEGLQNGEFCLWAADDPLPAEEAMGELRRAVPDLAGRMAQGQFEIFPSHELYRTPIDARDMIELVVERIKSAMSLGFPAMRCSGNSATMPTKDAWKPFMAYETKLNAVAKEFPVSIICSYSLERCGEKEIAEVRRHHQSTLVKRGDAWEFVTANAAGV